MKLRDEYIDNINLKGIKYLGYNLKAPYDKNNFHIEQLIKKTNIHLDKMQSTIIKNGKLTIKSIRTIYLQLIRPQLTYGAELIKLTNKQAQKLESTQMKFWIRAFK